MHATKPAILPLSALRPLFAYPGAEFPADMDRARAVVEPCGPEAAGELAAFVEAIGDLALDAREELYTRTFDLNPVCALEIGWHLFEKEYHRGAMLVRLRGELRRHGIEESSELPDHLTHVLELLSRMEDAAGRDFAHACVMPAVEAMLDGFAGGDNPYRRLLACVRSVLESQFGKTVEEPRA